MNKNLDVKVKDHRRHTLHDQLLSTDNLSNEHNSPRNRHRFLPVDTEYHRADINDRLGIKFSSTKFDWYHTESWLVIQNTIINVILCKSDPDIKASMTNLRQLTTSGVEMSHIIAYCEKKLLRNTMRILRRPLEDLSAVVRLLFDELKHSNFLLLLDMKCYPYRKQLTKFLQKKLLPCYPTQPFFLPFLKFLKRKIYMRFK
ncbi:unnamed protein product [Heterobilharzia americana]|nr:unnamed protein product [Heterobilharzia americana]